jgi:hypothetical protein
VARGRRDQEARAAVPRRRPTEPSLQGALPRRVPPRREGGLVHGQRRERRGERVLQVAHGAERGEEEPLEQDSTRDDECGRDEEDHDERQNKEADERPSAPPPPNALLFTRCRSAPAKGMSLSKRETAEPPAAEAEEKKGRTNADAGTKEDRNDLVFMSTAPGFLKLSIDIAKETWLFGSRDPLSRSRSWKR